MFSFLNSTILVAAAAALIPLIIHLFSRRKVKVIEFSSLRHLKEMQRRQLRRLKIRQLLLLLLRMLIILAVVMAFARPTARRGALGTHAAVSAVILYDNSASMNRSVADGELPDIARRRTHDLLATFSQSDEVCLLPLIRRTDEDAGELTTAAAAMSLLDRVRTGGGSADFQGGLTTAMDLLGGATNLNREIYVVSDRQRTSLPSDMPLEDSDVSLYLVDLPLEEVENLGVVAVDFGGQLLQPGHDFDVVATIRNYGDREAAERIASLFIDGHRVAQTDFEATAGGETSVRFTRSVSRTGYHSGYVELSDDRFPGDNRYYFSFRIPDQFNVLIIDGDASAQYVRMALVPDQSGTVYWSVKEARPDQLTGVNFHDYDVVMLVGVPELNESQTTRLKSFVRRGNALFATYGPEMSIDAFNQTWSEPTGVIYEQAVRSNFTRAGFYLLESLTLGHPVFSVFSFEDEQAPQIKFFALPRMTASEGSGVLMRFSGGQPALVESRMGNGRILMFTAPMSPQYTDLPSHGFFVPFISRVTEYLAADLSSLDIRLFAGQNITRGLSGVESVTRVVDLVKPDSSLIALAPEEDRGALVLRTGPLDLSGVYRISDRGRELDRFAVNLNPTECDLDAADLDQFAMAVGNEDYRELGSDVVLAETIATYRVGRELWQLFLWVAVILLAAEMLLGRGAVREE